MTQIKLNKASLSLEQKKLKNFQKYLPSLELKRKKLLTERSLVERQIASIKSKESELKEKINNDLPMAADHLQAIKKLIHIQAINIQEENIVGVRLPVFKSIEFNIADYSYLNSPHWLEHLIHLLSELIETSLEAKVLASRSQLLEKSLQTVTQRRNLFEKVLIPNARNHIRLIQIFLADNERAAVVRSKIAKKKRQIS
ncbi:V-type ATP synthase subunit D [Legionella massiliensis]|uniref:V-type ATP synthase subunit D n=1 Tax=Legionella massiliensis TaxID=1034943 RepID=A0A078L174_9GAMM|nr:V-type ATP synthase subunit D [Legionella massiliensis]CDZ78972.1 V-type ATP synthase subunit D [Legionella massiliensis]CEE14710.1 V-type ATP synthase subunit D [Legionella massiliensis]